MLEKIASLDPKILLADGFDDCLIGLTFRDDELVALYSSSRIIQKLSEDMGEEEALEYFEFNIEGAYVGPKTPMYHWDMLLDKSEPDEKEQSGVSEDEVHEEVRSTVSRREPE